jgi:hypothetical protein
MQIRMQVGYLEPKQSNEQGLKHVLSLHWIGETDT